MSAHYTAPDGRVFGDLTEALRAACPEPAPPAELAAPEFRDFDLRVSYAYDPSAWGPSMVDRLRGVWFWGRQLRGRWYP